MSSGQSRAGAPVVSPGALLLLTLTVLGLFAMHGLQATASPADTHPAALSLVMPADTHPADVSLAMPAMGRSETAAGHHGPTPSHDSPGHRHPGGGMCLALLVMATLLILSAVFVRRRRRWAPVGRPAGRGKDRLGRAPPPPSIFQLSVLRR
ncbi:DUF6153 family protein [Actinoallomurus spadix]|nr:DUF6153 family protein [Actinoallomurus spadix]